MNKLKIPKGWRRVRLGEIIPNNAMYLPFGDTTKEWRDSGFADDGRGRLGLGFNPRIIKKHD